MTTGHGQLHPYGSQFKLDDLVIVRNACEPESASLFRYFAYMIDGKIATWSAGCTSWTVDSHTDVATWDYCRKPTREEFTLRKPRVEQINDA